MKNYFAVKGLVVDAEDCEDIVAPIDDISSCESTKDI
jgi:hypothetical protein